MAKVYITTPFRLFTNGDFEIILDGSSVKDIVSNLVTRHNDLKRHIFTNSGELKSFVNIHLNEKNIKGLNNLDTKVYDDDKLIVFPAIA